MNKKILSIISLHLLLFTATHSMDLALASVADEQRNAENAKVAFLKKTVDQISEYKKTNPNKYLADMGKVLNATYAITFLREPLLKVKEHHASCKKTEPFVFYKGKYINGISTTIFEKLAPQIKVIKSPFGNLVEYTADYGDKEYNILAIEPTEITFLNELSGFETRDERIESWNFIKKHFNSSMPEIKIMALNCAYIISSMETTAEVTSLICLNEYFNKKDVQNYFSTFNLKQIFLKEFIATKMAVKAYDDAEEAPHSIIKKLEPLCSSSVCNQFKEEDTAFNEYYRKIAKETSDAVAEYATNIINQHKLKIPHHILCNQLLGQYCVIAPELETIFKCFGLSGYLPGIWAFEKPTPAFIAPKPTTKKTKTKKRKRNNKRNKQTETIHENCQEEKQQEAAQTPPTNNISSSESTSDTNNETISIFYDNRVLEKNKNKLDPYHGFTLITIPFIIKNGTHSVWLNKKTGYADDLVFMYGHIEYADNRTQKTEFVKFGLCTGEDGAIYHIEMKKTQETEELSYNNQFPPLSKPTTSYHNSTSDDYGSKVLAETDYMIQLWDGGLNATITLYK
jgi:hypothetical protein